VTNLHDVSPETEMVSSLPLNLPAGGPTDSPEAPHR
jgi:hypothetical protein